MEIITKSSKSKFPPAQPIYQLTALISNIRAVRSPLSEPNPGYLQSSIAVELVYQPGHHQHNQEYPLRPDYYLLHSVTPIRRCVSLPAGRANGQQGFYGLHWIHLL